MVPLSQFSVPAVMRSLVATDTLHVLTMESGVKLFVFLKVYL